MLRDDCRVPVGRRKHVAGVEADANGRHVRAERQSRRLDRRAGALRAELGIYDVPLMAIRKAEVQAGLRRNIQLVTRHVISESIAAVFGEPELPCHRVPIEPYAVAHALCEGFPYQFRRASFARWQTRTVPTGRRCTGAPTDMYSMSSGPKAMNFQVWPPWVWQVIAQRDRRRRCIEAFFDIVEPQEPARGCDVQRAVPHRDAIGLIEAARNITTRSALRSPSRSTNGVHLADILRSDEHGPLGDRRHRPRVLYPSANTSV